VWEYRISTLQRKKDRSKLELGYFLDLKAASQAFETLLVKQERLEETVWKSRGVFKERSIDPATSARSKNDNCCLRIGCTMKCPDERERKRERRRSAERKKADEREQSSGIIDLEDACRQCQKSERVVWTLARDEIASSANTDVGDVQHLTAALMIVDLKGPG